MVGTFLCTKYVAPVMMRQRWGRILNISSVMGKRGQPNASAYASANAAVHLFTQSAARELAPYGITVNSVCPGVTDTSRMDDLGRSERWEALLKTIPLGRAASDEEVGRFIAFLCTQACDYITGQALNFNGGTVMEH